MRFARIGERGHEVPVVVVDGRYRDLRSLTLDIDAAFWESDPVDLVSRALAEGTLPELPDAADTRIGAPIARPGAVVCVGMNYAAHAAESGSLPPEQPVIFLKVPNTVSGPNDDVELPRDGDKTDWEVELGIVIGRETSYLDSPDEAEAHIAGFVLVNDLSERRFQLEVSGGQWSKGKCAPGFTPTGPWVVTPDEVDTGDLRLRSFVNGAPRQDSNTGDMIFSVAHIIWHLSQFMTLEPGDLVLTGTPEGVALSGRFPYLQPGDEVEISIDGLGAQRQRFSAWSRS
ncbi:fumarylacetoacetate hydrolase family protein [Microbacterium sp. 22296]|uniref:fumarylacetoacetate hydrolase family protein n=1 Tax=Microbacterium sp. 22296 TaxID=3453903 RepID=UPI003F84C9C4